MKPSIEQIQIEKAPDDDHTLTVTLRGEATAIVAALVNGLALETLETLHDALDAELTKRAAER